MSNIIYVSEDLPDIAHETEPLIHLPIQKVGVRNVTAPVKLLRVKKTDLKRKKKSPVDHWETFEAIADISMYVSLQAHTKGISMSPLTFALKSKLDRVFDHEVIDEILLEIKEKTEVTATDSYFKMRFRYPVDKKSPVTEHIFPELYDCEVEGVSVGDQPSRFYLTVTVPYMSYCPCSAKLSEHLMREEGIKGYPHAQRSLVRATIEPSDTRETFSIRALVHLLEGAINYCIPYPIIRRVDERELAKIAGQNLLFCEDAARLFAQALEDQSRIKDYVLVCNHFESIHTSEAVSIIRKGIPGGLK